MGWTVSFQMLRDEPLTEQERGRLAAFSVERGKWDWDSEPFDIEIATAPRGDGVVARGMTKLSLDEESLDCEQVTSCLEDLAAAFPGARLLIADDFEAVGSDEMLDIWGDEGFAAAKTLLARPKRASTATKPANVKKMLARLVEIDDGDDRESKALVRELEKAEGNAVIAAALGSYRKLNKAWWLIRDALDAAVGRSSDLAQHAPAFLELWNARGGTYWHQDLLGLSDPLLEALAPVAEVDAQMCSDLSSTSERGASERDCRRAGYAARMLAHATSTSSLAELLGLLQRTRDADEEQVSFNYNHHVILAVIEAVAERGDARAFATLVLTLDRMQAHWDALGKAARAIGAMDPLRGEPLLVQMAALQLFLDDVAEGLAAGNSPAGEAALETLLVDPLEHIRRAAAEALSRRRGVEVAAPDVTWDPLEHLTHPRLAVRHRALREVADKKRKPDVLALALADALDARLARVIDYPGLPFSWHEWHKKLPEEVIELSRHGLAAWALERAESDVAKQRIPTCVRPLIDRGVDAVASDYAEPLFRLSAEQRAALEAEERTIVAAL